uniref:Lipocalin/cytosolic fatty-acid binding domain-containing protein n=1 Tax=Alexandrium monilatum TaxID=311494 RepID=A0A7S4VZT9_9DINO
MAASALRAFAVAAAAWVPAVAGCSTKDVAAMRSDAVKDGFDPAAFEGFWYEHAYIDPAQVGASCQTLNATLNPATGEVATDFSVRYGAVPFTIKEFYDPVDPATRGVYNKHVQIPFNIPGGSLIQLPTAVVDVQRSSDGSRYETMILYSCLALVSEVVIATRGPTLERESLQVLLQTAKERGVPFKESGVSTVDRSSCPKAAAGPPFQEPQRLAAVAV